MISISFVPLLVCSADFVSVTSVGSVGANSLLTKIRDSSGKAGFRGSKDSIASRSCKVFLHYRLPMLEHLSFSLVYGRDGS
eukprot:1687373-Amphidinium_carterae.1